MFVLLAPKVPVVYLFWPKHGLGYILATFSQTHLVTLMPTVRFFRENPILSKFLRFYYFAKNIIIERPTCPGGVVIGPGNRTEDRGFESHHGVCNFIYFLCTLQWYIGFSYVPNTCLARLPLLHTYVKKTFPTSFVILFQFRATDSLSDGVMFLFIQYCYTCYNV
jgi:hypothetical protein